MNTFKHTAYKYKFSPAFTLMEILVVVLIVGLLAAIAVPSFRMARRKVQDILVLNNLKQIWNAAQLCFLEDGVEEVHINDIVWYTRPDGTLMSNAKESYTSVIKFICGENYSRLSSILKSDLFVSAIVPSGTLFANEHRNTLEALAAVAMPGRIMAESRYLAIPFEDGPVVRWKCFDCRAYNWVDLETIRLTLPNELISTLTTLGFNLAGLTAETVGVFQDIFQDYADAYGSDVTQWTEGQKDSILAEWEWHQTWRYVIAAQWAEYRAKITDSENAVQFDNFVNSMRTLWIDEVLPTRDPLMKTARIDWEQYKAAVASSHTDEERENALVDLNGTYSQRGYEDFWDYMEQNIGSIPIGGKWNGYDEKEIEGKCPDLSALDYDKSVFQSFANGGMAYAYEFLYGVTHVINNDYTPRCYDAFYKEVKAALAPSS
jgi:prepilin-type N-terminal cleavage/methylation domain-containing protein